MTINRKPYRVALFLALCLASLGLPFRHDAVSAAASSDQHSYFEALLRRADVWKSVSFRAPADLAGNSWVTYDPANDTDRHKQDAAKIVVPSWMATTQLSQSMTSGATVMNLVTAYKPLYGPGRIIRVDSEIMTVASWVNETSITVTRGSYGTSPASHAASAGLWHSTNSLQTQARFMLGTQDGHDYSFVWDAYWTDSYMGVGVLNHKAFQFTSGGPNGDAIWLQPQVTYAPNSARCYNTSQHIGSFSVRSLQKTGGESNWSSSDGDSLGPAAKVATPLSQTSEFCIEPNMWVRFFMRIRQKANDYDPVDMWIADERRDPVQVVMNGPVSVRPSGATPNSINRFWVEFNSSEDGHLRLDNRDLVSYVRNFVALKDVRDFDNLLVRPVPGAEPGAGPGAPTNVHIIR